MVRDHHACHSGRERLRRNRRLQPAGGRMIRPLRPVTFRSYPVRMEDLRLAPHGILDTVARPVGRSPGSLVGKPRRDRRPALMPRLRGPSHRPRV